MFTPNISIYTNNKIRIIFFLFIKSPVYLTINVLFSSLTNESLSYNWNVNLYAPYSKLLIKKLMLEYNISIDNVISHMLNMIDWKK